jgi:hypothetical protein
VGFILEAACVAHVNVNIMAEIHQGVQLIEFFIESCDDKDSRVTTYESFTWFSKSKLNVHRKLQLEFLRTNHRPWIL